ncbi:helix-turn-helix domain-containing protein [Brevibacterium linens]|uniref:helix-turn-helix domain-containing protein n=1 Tax=Brevibacterium linens TaxID=1703 RepID=UPI003F8B6026
MRYTRQVRANVLAEMGRRELKQGDVAQILNTSQRSVSKRMTGDTDWRIGDLLRLAQAWDIPIATLLQGTEDDPFAPNGDPKPVGA